MLTIFIVLATAAQAYLLGSVDTGILISKYLYHDDVRNHGSGAAGMTNMLRTFGKKAAALTATGDVLKGVIAVCIGRWLFGYLPEGATVSSYLGVYLAAILAVIGHLKPLYFGFKGGKGIAATAGLILSMSWQMTLLSILTFGTAVALTHYVSLGSLLVYIGFLIELIVFGQNGMFGMSQAHLNEMYVVAVLLTALAFFMHRANIVRLIHGTERKTYLFRHKK